MGVGRIFLMLKMFSFSLLPLRQVDKVVSYIVYQHHYTKVPTRVLILPFYRFLLFSTLLYSTISRSLRINRPILPYHTVPNSPALARPVWLVPFLETFFLILPVPWYTIRSPLFYSLVYSIFSILHSILFLYFIFLHAYSSLSSPAQLLPDHASLLTPLLPLTPPLHQAMSS
jgi:hypothetical protein